MVLGPLAQQPAAERLTPCKGAIRPSRAPGEARGRDDTGDGERAGDWYDPEIKAIERQVIETGLKMGVAPRAEINSPEQARYYLDLGVRHFCIATDILILYDWLKENGERLRQVISDV